MEGLFYLNSYVVGVIRRTANPFLNTYTSAIRKQTGTFSLIGTGGGESTSVTVPTTGQIYPRTINI
jgi:hypothetical protein